MSSVGDVTLWLRQFKGGDRTAAQPLWELYFRRLTGLVREKLQGLPRTAVDEEDVALSAFDSFFRRAEAGCFPRLDDRDDLWQLLLLIATRKVYDLAEREGRERRDWRRTQSVDDAEMPEPFSGEPDPAVALAASEELARLLALLPDESTRTIATHKLEGFTNQEIAGLQGCSLATVERRLALIRKFWQRDVSA